MREQRVRLRLLPLFAAVGLGALGAWGVRAGLHGERAPSPASQPAAQVAQTAEAGGLAEAHAASPPEEALTAPGDGTPAAPLAAPEAASPAAIPVTPAAPPDQPPPAEDPQPPPATPEEPTAAAAMPERRIVFREVWGYLMPGENSLWSDAAPLTDLVLFDLSLDPTAHLSGKVNRAAIDRARERGIRTHLAVASSGNKALLHLALSARYGVRRELLAGIAELPRRHGVAGVQLDFEGPRPEERADLVSFVRELRALLPREALLSVALPAKTTDRAAAFVYSDFADLADRLFIMVYDEHWKGGPPGSISGLAWHDGVLACARAQLPQDRVVVGLPFYGRVWQREEVARAVRHAQARDLASRTAAEVRRDPARTHSFTFRTEVTAECWFEDAASLRSKLESAARSGFRNVGFWRLGQEDERIWSIVGRE